MAPTRRSLLRAGCGLLAGGSLAGCVGDSPSNGSDTSTETGSFPGSPSSEDATVSTKTEQATTSATNETTSANGDCNGARDLTLKPHDGVVRWNQRSVQVGGFSLGANAHVVLVVYEGDTVLGTAESSAPPDTPIVVDGQSIPLRKRLTGEHTIRVVMYPGSDGTGKFDPESATPCRHEGSVIQAGPETIDFSEFTPGTPTTATTP